MQNLEVMVVLFIIVILGYVACKLGYMGDKFDKKLSSIVVDITCPLLVLSSVMGDELPDRTLILPLLGVGFLTYILFRHIYPRKTRQFLVKIKRFAFSLGALTKSCFIFST